LNQYKGLIFEPEEHQFKDMNTFISKMADKFKPQVRVLNANLNEFNKDEVFLEGEYLDDNGV
jgi:hypothetical protein